MKKLTKIATTSVGLCILLTMTGCLGMAIRSSLLDKIPFETALAQAANPSANQARVWIYVVGGGPNPLNSAGDADWLTFNDRIQSVGGNSYLSIELPAGAYEVTADGVYDTHGFLNSKVTYRKGKHRKQFVFEGGKTYFMRTAMTGSGFAGPTPISKITTEFGLVERSQAEQDCLKFKRWKGAQIQAPLEDSR